MRHLTAVLVFLVVFFMQGCGAITPQPKAYGPDLDSETVALVGPDEEGGLRIFCTGVWISNTEILTAGHCAEVAGDEPVGQSIGYVTQREAGNPGDDIAKAHEAIVVAEDHDHDLALLKVKGPWPLLHKSASVAADVPQAGEHISIVGHPAGLGWTHMEGVVAAYRSELPSGFEGPFLQVSAPIWFGNSGGGAFNDSGELIGIASFMIKRVPNCGFFIPTKSIHAFLKHAHCSGTSCSP